MNNQLQPVSVVILGKEYKIACADEEKENLLSSARDLDRQMREIRDTGKVNSPDRIAVMAALNLAHELRQTQQHTINPPHSLINSLAKLRQKIENALENS